MQLDGLNIIAGKNASPSTVTFRAVNAATGEEFEPRFHEATATDVNDAYAAAVQAFATFSQTTGVERAAFLRAISDGLLALSEEQLARTSQETGLPMGRLIGERVRTTTQLHMFANLVEEGSWVDARIDVGDGSRTPLPKPDVRRMLVSLGPVAVFGASNFPFAFSVPGGDTASAFAAGCPVVCKAHPAHPGTSEMCAQVINAAARACGIDPGVFSLLHGWSHSVGIAIAEHPAARAVGFTGSLRGGRAIFDAAHKRAEPIPVYAEMGSVNPVFVLPEAAAQRGEAIAAGLAQSITQGVGQFCTNPGVVVGVLSEPFKKLCSIVAAGIANTVPAAMLYPQLRSAFHHALGEAVNAGARVIGGTSAPAADENLAHALLFEVSANEFVQNKTLRGEMFGPVSVVVAARDRSELEQVATSLEGQLTATVHGTEEELPRYRDLISMLEQRVGRIIINGYPTGVEVTHAMHHGGPYPASTDARTTSVGSAAINRFARPVCYQNFPESLLPEQLRNGNSRGLWRLVDGELSREPIGTRPLS